MNSLHVVQGDAVEDRRFLDKVARRSKRSETWILPRHAAVGDDVLIFIVGVGLYATAKVAGPIHKRRDWKHRYGAPLSQIRLVSPPISLAQISAAAPKFIWTNYPRSITTPSPIIANQLRKLVQMRRAKKIDATGKQIAQLGLGELKHLATNGPAKKTSRKVWSRQRVAFIKEYAQKRADGHCEGCGKYAPFVTSNGRPFLEVHHITSLSDDGPDHPRNVVALCPNCHRRAHHAADAKSFNSRLRQKAKRLYR